MVENEATTQEAPAGAQAAATGDVQVSTSAPPEAPTGDPDIVTTSGMVTHYGKLPEYADESPEALVDYWYQQTHPRWPRLTQAEKKAKAMLVDYIGQFVVHGSAAKATGREPVDSAKKKNGNGSRKAK